MSTLPVAVITGGTSGIGLAIVHDLARDHRVFALGRNKDSLLALRLIENVEAVEIDLLDFIAVQRFVDALPEIDVLVHSAAISKPLRLDQARPEDWQQQFSINVFAPAEFTRLALPALRKQEGQVIFIGSGSGTKADGGNTVYCASKFALSALAHALRQEESGYGVRVSTVAPGPTDTPMNRKTRESQGNFDAIDPREYSAPDSVAAAVRLVISASDDTQITDIAVRPRRDKAKR